VSQGWRVPATRYSAGVTEDARLANVVVEIFREIERNWIPGRSTRRRSPTALPHRPTASHQVTASQLIYPVKFAAQSVRDAKEDLRAWETLYEQNPTEDGVREVLAAQMRLEAARLALRKLSRS
jgi:hypothetical protein